MLSASSQQANALGNNGHCGPGPGKIEADLKREVRKTKKNLNEQGPGFNNKENNDEQRKKEKVVNYKKKADNKVNQGRTTLMDARLWTRRVDDDLGQMDPNLRKQCLD